MAIQTRIDVLVDDAPFQASVRAFDKYRVAARKSPELWARYGDQVKAAERTAAELTGAFEVHGAHIERTRLAHERFADRAKAAGSVFSRLASDTGALAKNLSNMVFSLLSTMTLMGAVGGLLGFAGGLFGMDEMSRVVTARRRTAMGLGIGYGQLSSAGINFGRFGDVEGQLGAVSGAEYDVRNPVYTALLASGITPSGNAAADLVKLQSNIPGLFAGVPEGQIGWKAATLGIAPGVMSMQELIRRLHAQSGEFEAQYASYQADIAKMTLTPEAQSAWADFNTQLIAAGNTIESVLGRVLAPLAEPTGELSKGFVDVIDALSKSSLLTDAVHGLEGGLRWFSGKIGGSEFQTNARHFLDGLEKLESYLRPIVRVGKFLNLTPNQIAASPSKAIATLFGPEPDTHALGVRGAGLPSIRYGTRRRLPLPHTAPSDALAPGLIPGTDMGGGTVAPERNRLLRLRAQGRRAASTALGVPEGTVGAAAPPAGPAGAVSAAGDPVAVASTVLGENEVQNQVDLERYLAAGGVHVNPQALPWCAGFVNATLAQAGVRGTGSLMAGSFASWGQPVDPLVVQSGDIGEYRSGAHVGFLTGATRIGDTGEEEVQLLAGNEFYASRYGTPGRSQYGKVGEHWMPASELNIRRATSDLRIRPRQEFEDPSIIARRGMLMSRAPRTSYLDHFRGAKIPKAIIVNNSSDGVVTHSRSAYG